MQSRMTRQQNKYMWNLKKRTKINEFVFFSTYIAENWNLLSKDWTVAKHLYDEMLIEFLYGKVFFPPEWVSNR